MRKPASPRSATNYVANNYPVQAPTGGWNAVSAITNMPREDAIFLDNFYPTPTEVTLRKGYEYWGEIPTDNPPGSPHDIRTIMGYTPITGSAKFFVADNSGIYDMTLGGVVPTAATSATNGEWQYTMINTAGGSFLWCCNGVDSAKSYNGTTWANVTVTGLTGGKTSANLVDVAIFKFRLYAVISDSLKYCYLGVNSISGAASEVDLGVLFKRGGKLVKVDTWSLDGGAGIDDYIIFYTSAGEVAVYQGYDPSNAATWSLVGVFFVGAPLGKRCTAKVGGNLLLLTVQGVYPLSKALENATVSQQVALSYKIQPALDHYIQLGRDMYGWQLTFYPEATMLIVNVPFKRDDASNYLYSYQFAMNTTHNAWCRFTDMASEVWGTHLHRMFFAKHNKIYQAWTGYIDGTNAIRAKAKQSFITVGSTGMNKHVKLVRPIFRSEASLSLGLGLDVDFKSDTLIQHQNSPSQSIALWDQAVWNQATWSGSSVKSQWRTVNNFPGMWFSLNVSIESNKAAVSWLGTQYSAIAGGYI